MIWNLGSYTDIFVLFSFISIRNKELLRNIVNHYIQLDTVIDVFKGIVPCIIFFQSYRYITTLRSCSQSSDGFLFKPMIFPCRTTHRRLFPKKHSFSYSYLLVGIPIGWKGLAGGMIACDMEKNPIPWYRRLLSLGPGSAWYTVNGDDYLARGHVGGGLRGKLDAYLLSQVRNSPKGLPLYRLTLSSGREARILPTRISAHCSSLPWLFKQPCLNLESILVQPHPLSNNPRSQQYFR